MLVKICGITRPQDAQAAVDLGASAIGFIFWPKSPRYIEPAAARAIAASLPAFVTAVGVFVNEPVPRINEVARETGLGAVQLHGDEAPADLAGLERPVVKAISRIEETTAGRWPARVRLLVDADDPVRRGGTGARADWNAAAALARQRPIVLAGGITPENVADALHAVRPFGIDVSSGVEAAPGIKDAARLQALFDALRRTQESSEERGPVRVR